MVALGLVVVVDLVTVLDLVLALESLEAVLGLVEDLVVALGDFANVLEDLVEVADWECVVGDLYLEGFVGYEGLDFVLDPLVLSPLMVVLEDLALEGSVLGGFVLEGFSQVLLSYLDQQPLFGPFFAPAPLGVG